MNSTHRTPPSRGLARAATRTAQTGATLLVGMIMLLLITLLVTNAFLTSNANLRTVTNLQMRDEALAAGNQAIEQVIGTTFALDPVADQIDVDLNQDGTNDYRVIVALPTCISAKQVPGIGNGYGSSAALGLPTATTNYDTVWEIDASVTDLRSGVAGATLRVREGVRLQQAGSEITGAGPSGAARCL